MQDMPMYGLDSKEFLLEENQDLRKLVVELRQERDLSQKREAVLSAENGRLSTENGRLSTENKDLKRDNGDLSRKLRYVSGETQDSVPLSVELDVKPLTKKRKRPDIKHSDDSDAGILSSLPQSPVKMRKKASIRASASSSSTKDTEIINLVSSDDEEAKAEPGLSYADTSDVEMEYLEDAPMKIEPAKKEEVIDAKFPAEMPSLEESTGHDVQSASSSTLHLNRPADKIKANPDDVGSHPDTLPSGNSESTAMFESETPDTAGLLATGSSTEAPPVKSLVLPHSLSRETSRQGSSASHVLEASATKSTEPEDWDFTEIRNSDDVMKPPLKVVAKSLDSNVQVRPLHDYLAESRSLQRIKTQYMSRISLSINPVPRRRYYSREYIADTFGGNRRSFIQKVNGLDCVFAQRIMNPVVVDGPGLPGLMFASRLEIVEHPPWQVFCQRKTLEKNATVWEYVGGYESKVVGELSGAAFAGLPPAVKKEWGKRLCEIQSPGQDVYVSLRARVGLRRDGIPITPKTEQAEMEAIRAKGGRIGKGDGEAIEAAISAGEEFIKILEMTCISYDHAFAEMLENPPKDLAKKAAMKKKKGKPGPPSDKRRKGLAPRSSQSQKRASLVPVESEEAASEGGPVMTRRSTRTRKPRQSLNEFVWTDHDNDSDSEGSSSEGYHRSDDD